MSDQAETWAKVELMGHVCLWGRLTEEEKFGSKIGRMDVPSEEGFSTQYFGGASVYRITVVSEAVARDHAKKNGAAPVSSWDYPKPALSYTGGQSPMTDHEDDPENDVDIDEEVPYPG